MITLYTGEDRIKFHVHEDKLCELSFFRAALQGQFKEASEKAINMPEDDPDAVSALIEWLYTGGYTIHENKLYESTMKLREVSEVLDPSPAFLRGLLHLEVYVVASKYDCSALQREARNSYYAAHRAITPIESLRLFKAACTANTHLLPSKLGLYPPENSLAKIVEMTKRWTGKLFDSYDEETQKTLEDFPMIAIDILRITTTTSTLKDTCRRN